MQISFRTKLFDTSSPKNDDRFYGQDLAKWLKVRLVDWETEVFEEDWGWEIIGKKEKYKYFFGVYDHDTGDENEFGALWFVRVFNQRDRSQWFKKLFKNIPPISHKEVVNEVLRILKKDEAISEIKVTNLD